MKKLKQLDAWVQILLITSCTLFALIKGASYFLGAYFVVGSWQVLSTIVHTIAKWNAPNYKFREYYNWILGTLAMAYLVAIYIPSLMYLLLLVLLFISPALAILYTAVCFEESKELNTRPLAQLK